MTTPAPSTPAASPTTVDIELLALDLETCTRCTGSLASIESALALTRPVLEAAGIGVRLTERVIRTETEAQRHRFRASPTIRIGGIDIAPELHESRCESCTELCGCASGTSCREWEYRGELHTEAPPALVAEAIMRAAFAPGSLGASVLDEATPSEDIPENLKQFFASRRDVGSTGGCCSASAQEGCCAPEEKDSCCGAGATGTCGCQ